MSWGKASGCSQWNIRMWQDVEAHQREGSQKSLPSAPLCPRQGRCPCWLCPLHACLCDQTHEGLTKGRAQRMADWEEQRLLPQPCLAAYSYRVRCCSLPGIKSPLIHGRERPLMLPSWFHYAGAERKPLERPFPSTAAQKTSWCIFMAFPSGWQSSKDSLCKPHLKI